MGFLDRLLGREEAPQYEARPSATRAPERSADEIAVERYRYLLRTAPPETIEQVHLEAFSKLTDAQRTLLFEQLSADSSPSERPSNASPSSLAHAATRQELRNPGSMERSLNSAGQRGGGMGFGGTFASSLLGSVTGFVIGSAIASAFMPDPSDMAGSDASADGSGDTGSDASTAGSTDGSTDGSGDAGGSGDFGDSGFGGGFGDSGFGDSGFGGDFGGDFGV
jgi:hypothetical protein